MRDFIEKFKVELSFKEVGMWFGLSFLAVASIELIILDQKLSPVLFIEILGFALVFVILMIATKSYSHFVEDYYQKFIDKRERKERRNIVPKAYQKKKRS